LPKLHAILIKEGLIPEANQASGIFDVLRRATTKQIIGFDSAQPTCTLIA
jgi:hypothetical protein